MTSLHCWRLLLDLCSYNGGTVFIYHYKSSFYDIVDLFQHVVCGGTVKEVSREVKGTFFICFRLGHKNVCAVR